MVCRWYARRAPTESMAGGRAETHMEKGSRLHRRAASRKALSLGDQGQMGQGKESREKVRVGEGGEGRPERKTSACWPGEDFSFYSTRGECFKQNTAAYIWKWPLTWCVEFGPQRKKGDMVRLIQKFSKTPRKE